MYYGCYITDLRMSTFVLDARAFRDSVTRLERKGEAVMAQDDLKEVIADWMDRRFDALGDLYAWTGTMLTMTLPFDLIRFQQHMLSNAFLRWTEDTTACQEIANKMLERSSFGFRSLAERTAAATRAAGKPLRDTSTPSYGSASAD
jgi:hypothetical protein